MTLQVLDIPDDSRQLPSWLERQLVGGDLAALVVQLRAVHKAPAQSPSTLNDLLGDRREALLRNGLSTLNDAQLARLLVQPNLLVELQELVVLEGGSHWTRGIEGSPEQQTHLMRARRRILRYLTTHEDQPIASPATSILQQSRWSWRAVLVGLATAAMVLIAVFGYQHFAVNPNAFPTAVAWGWAKPGAIPQTGSREEYLKMLADAAEQWFNKRPTTAEDLAQRIVQLRQGCSTVLLAAHKPLTELDREWLKDRCQAWANKFDAQLAKVEAGENPLIVRDETDAAVHKLIDALRNRAKMSVTT